MKSHDVLKRVVEAIGTKQVASDLKVSTSLVYKWCAEPPAKLGDDASGARNPLDRLIQLYQSTNDRRPIEWLCNQADGFFVLSVETEPETIDEAYVSHTQRLLSEFSELLHTVADSMAHEGRIDAPESTQIRAKWQSLQSCAESFVQACERGNFDREIR
jgi:hypothetical protein